MQKEFVITTHSKLFDVNLHNEPRIWNNKTVSSVEIEVETLLLQHPSAGSAKGDIIMERPTKICGVIIPYVTKARKVTPNPVAFDSLAHYISSVRSHNRFRFISPHSDRGHIFALELGGPNCKYNIIPQWSGFQEHGDWRRLERTLKKSASALLEKGNTLFLEVSIEYMNLNMQDLQEQMHKIFDMHNLNEQTESKYKKCLQIFGIPQSCSFTSYPCNALIKKPSKHSLSISYIRHLYDVAKRAYYDTGSSDLKTKIKQAQKGANSGWGRSVLLTNFINHDEKLLTNIDDICPKGTFVLSAITEGDVNSG